MIRRAIILVAIAAIAGGSAPAGQQASTTIVVELFTSQGCSSCPPADELAGRLAREPGMLVVTRPVTYWDRLGWKDTLALPANTELQRAYAARGSSNGVYTPQMVVDGQSAEVGSREEAVRSMIGRARERAHAAIAVVPSGQDLGIGVAGRDRANAEIMLVTLDPNEKVAIGRGENGGRTVTYANVVVSERRIGKWSGGKQGFPVRAADLEQGSQRRQAIIVREPGGGPVLAGTMLPSR